MAGAKNWRNSSAYRCQKGSWSDPIRPTGMLPANNNWMTALQRALFDHTRRRHGQNNHGTWKGAHETQYADQTWVSTGSVKSGAIGTWVLQGLGEVPHRFLGVQLQSIITSQGMYNVSGWQDWPAFLMQFELGTNSG